MQKEKIFIVYVYFDWKSQRGHLIHTWLKASGRSGRYRGNIEWLCKLHHMKILLIQHDSHYTSICNIAKKKKTLKTNIFSGRFCSAFRQMFFMVVFVAI